MNPTLLYTCLFLPGATTPARPASCARQFTPWNPAPDTLVRLLHATELTPLLALELLQTVLSEDQFPVDVLQLVSPQRRDLGTALSLHFQARVLCKDGQTRAFWLYVMCEHVNHQPGGWGCALLVGLDGGVS